MRNGFWNRESKKLLRTLERKTLLGQIRPELFSLVFLVTYQVKGIVPDEAILDRFLTGFSEKSRVGASAP